MVLVNSEHKKIEVEIRKAILFLSTVQKYHCENCIAVFTKDAQSTLISSYLIFSSKTHCLNVEWQFQNYV